MMRQAIPAALLLAVSWGTGFAQTTSQTEAQPAQAALSQQIAALLAAPAVARDHWGIQVTTLEGQPLYSLNEGQLFQPASNAKLFTTAAAMALLGPSTTVTTSVAAVGYYTDKEHFKGNLYLDGSGDANLSGRAIPYVPNTENEFPPLRYLDELASQVASTGLKTLDGDLIALGTYPGGQPYSEGWSADDLVWGYGAPVTMLSINDNQLKLTVRPGAKEDDLAAIEIDPAVPYYTITNQVETWPTGSETRIAVDRKPGSKQLRIYGDIALKAAPDVEHISIDDPNEFAAIAFKQILLQHGVSIAGQARAEHGTGLRDARGFREISSEPLDLEKLKAIKIMDAHGFYYCAQPCDESKVPHNYPLGSHTSPSLAQDVVVTNKDSQNLHAELLLFRLGIHFGGTFWPFADPFAEGSRVVRQFLVDAGLDPRDFIFFDGSGLSGHDLVTPRATAKLLQYATTQTWFAEWKASLPIGGVDGTLESRFTKPPLKGHVFAKTGTLGEARALSGYLDAASGRTVIFSILVGNHLPGDSSDREAMDKIVALIQADN